MAAWLSQPVKLHSSRAFTCGDFTPQECEYYQHKWHFWYETDHVFALPTIAFFTCVIGIFTLGQFMQGAAALRARRGPEVWYKALAVVRYLSYRGFHVRSLHWNAAPVGVLLLGAIGAIYFFCMDLAPSPYYFPNLNWGSSPPLGTRSGWLSLACMPFVFATASKTNWITLLTGVSYEKLQVFHRWIAYAFFILALMHTFPFIVFHIREHDLVEQVTKDATLFYWTGIVALVFQAWLTFASFSSLRNWSYEFFKAAHFGSAVVFVLIFFWHCDFTLSSWDYFIATAVIYVPCLIYPWLRTCFEYGLVQRAQIFVEENGFTTITIPGNFHWVPGQHCFLRFGGFGIHALTSHPFTICSLPSTNPQEKSSITFHIRHRGGFTARLHNHAMKRPGVSVPVLVDGPYGGINPLNYQQSDRLLVIAGGSGAGWCLPFIELFARCHYDAESEPQSPVHASDEKDPTLGTEKESLSPRTGRKPQSLRVILVTRDTATRVWFQKKVSRLLSTHASPAPNIPFDLQVYLTGEAEQYTDCPLTVRAGSEENSEGEPISSSSTVTARPGVEDIDKMEQVIMENNHIAQKELQGRPNLPLIIQHEAAGAADDGESLGVFVCGPLTMQHDARNAVAAENLTIVKKKTRSAGVYLHLEHFSWA